MQSTVYITHSKDLNDPDWFPAFSGERQSAMNFFLERKWELLSEANHARSLGVKVTSSNAPKITVVSYPTRNVAVKIEHR